VQEILTQLRTIFDLIINFQKIQHNMYCAAKDELEARQNYDISKISSEERVRLSLSSFLPFTLDTDSEQNQCCFCSTFKISDSISHPVWAL